LIQAVSALSQHQKNFQEKFLHRAILPGALCVDLRSLKSVPDRFLTMPASARPVFQGRVAAKDGRLQKTPPDGGVFCVSTLAAFS